MNEGSSSSVAGDSCSRVAPAPIVRHSMATIRHLLAVTFLGLITSARGAIERDAWRMLHMTPAKISHYQPRGDQIRAPLRT